MDIKGLPGSDYVMTMIIIIHVSLSVGDEYMTVNKLFEQVTFHHFDVIREQPLK